MDALLNGVGLGLVTFSGGAILAWIARIVFDKIRPKPMFLVSIEEDEEDGGYIASCLSLPGCHSQGETPELAMENLIEAIHAYMDVLAAEQREKSVVDARQSIAPVQYVSVRSSMKIA